MTDKQEPASLIQDIIDHSKLSLSVLDKNFSEYVQQTKKLEMAAQLNLMHYEVRSLYQVEFEAPSWINPNIADLIAGKSFIWDLCKADEIMRQDIIQISHITPKKLIYKRGARRYVNALFKSTKNAALYDSFREDVSYLVQFDNETQNKHRAVLNLVELPCQSAEYFFDKTNKLSTIHQFIRFQ